MMNFMKPGKDFGRIRNDRKEKQKILLKNRRRAEKQEEEVLIKNRIETLEYKMGVKGNGNLWFRFA